MQSLRHCPVHPHSSTTLPAVYAFAFAWPGLASLSLDATERLLACMIQTLCTSVAFLSRHLCPSIPCQRWSH